MTYSKEGQDLFVLEQTNNMKGGFFLDIGCSYAKKGNNTYLLESKYGWTGILFDNDPRYIEEIHNFRKSPLILKDAATLDYDNLFVELKVPKVIDYISLDLDPAENTLRALKALPLDSYQFKVMTFEHDRYSHDDKEAVDSRLYLKSLGYKLLRKDVMCLSGPFEDWYINEELL